MVRQRCQWNSIVPEAHWAIPKSGSMKMLPSRNDYLHARKSKILIGSFHRARGTTGHTQPNVVASGTTYAWWLTPWKKDKIQIDFSQRYCWSKNPAREVHLVISNQKRYFKMLPFLIDHLLANKIRYQWLFPEILIIEEFWILIWEEPSLLWWLSPCKKSKVSIDSFHR